jgi:glycine/D-amino acid oxidase-like deaminating enzyme
VHGLATSYYLARYQGVKNIAVLEKGYLGGGSDTDGWITSACYSPNLEFNGDSLGMKEFPEHRKILLELTLRIRTACRRFGTDLW